VRGVVLFVHRWTASMHRRLSQAGAPEASTDEFNNAAGVTELIKIRICLWNDL